ncbi:MFS transporter [Desulfosporosinus sp. PR]|uniref:MFS transporter n=1 Tax=Candidatus Desulfosporosinus nitrosoreducens TaxID=3401928 RepID=UPI0027E78E37|nr:MFS transporter [Desulfosporosinus sp. PR]MDQ7094870.1 MFS transporter [Desulfosporosinus sp. PR]
MDKTILKRNNDIFCIYRFTSRFYMYLPILPIILLNYGLSFSQISYVLATHGLSIMLFKEPVSILVKKIKSNKIVIFMGEIFKSLGVLGLAFSQNAFWLIIIAQVISGLGFALTSSTESNLLLKTMKALDAQSEYRDMEARSQGFGFISILISGIIGAIITKNNMAMAMYLTAPFSLLAAVIILLMYEPKTLITNVEIKENELKRKDRGEISGVIHLLLYYAVNRAVSMTVFIFIYPLSLKLASIDEKFFGLIIGLFSVTAFLIGKNFKRVISIFKESQSWFITPTVLLGAILLMILNDHVGLMLVPILLGIAASIVRPLAMGKLNMVIKENNVAVMSRGEQIFGLFNALFLLLVGYSITYSNLANTLYILSLILVLINIIQIILFKVMRKVSKRAEYKENVC